MSVSATKASETDFEVTLLANGTASITKYHGGGGNIAVPATIQGAQVTQIGEGAFKRKSTLTGVQLPEGIKAIGSYAFAYSGISTIIIPDSVTVFGDGIFDSAGYGSNLRSFTFPAWLKIIPPYMFRCTGLSGSLIIPEGIEIIGEQAFSACQNVTSVTLPSTIKRIDFYAFNKCDHLTEVIIPARVTGIQWYEGFGGAFYGCPQMNPASQARLKQLGYKGSF